MNSLSTVCQTILTDRSAMGLPNHFTPSVIDDLSDDINELDAFNTSELLTALNSGKSLKQRFSAGLLLALSGDPRINTLSPEMIAIGAANFTMGIDKAEAEKVVERYAHLGVVSSWIMKECPKHTASIDGFYLAKYPVTNQEYRDFLLDSSYDGLPSSWPLGQFPVTKANHPVHTVSLDDIHFYISWLNKKTSKTYRLPSEAEWEYAAKGDSDNEFPWGNHFSTEYTNTVESGIFSTTPVGMYPQGQSPFGVHDITGNVEEYVSGTYYVYPGGEHQTDHLNQNGEDYAVARGGSFSRFSDLARTTRRHGNFALFDREIFAMGFRLALNK